jgi:pyruvate formate lyase activating enzyme
MGCNLSCQYCQNWQISQAPNQNLDIPFTYYSPKEILQLAVKNYCKLIVFAYNEPLIWHEYILDTGKLAHDQGLQVAISTSGYASQETINELIPVVDAVVVDIKAFNDQFFRKICGVPSKKPVLDAITAFKEHGVHLELSYLLIPEKNDKLADLRSLCEWIVDSLGDTVPLHFAPFFPAFHMLNVPQTPSDTLDNAYKIAKSIGLKHVYISNRLGKDYENTICSQCQKEVIVREAGEITQWNLTAENNCKSCNTPAPIQGNYTKSNLLWRKSLF